MPQPRLYTEPLLYLASHYFCAFHHSIIQCCVPWKMRKCHYEEQMFTKEMHSSYILVLNNDFDFNFGWSYLNYFYWVLQHRPNSSLGVEKSNVNSSWASGWTFALSQRTPYYNLITGVSLRDFNDVSGVLGMHSHSSAEECNKRKKEDKMLWIFGDVIRGSEVVIQLTLGIIKQSVLHSSRTVKASRSRIQCHYVLDSHYLQGSLSMSLVTLRLWKHLPTIPAEAEGSWAHCWHHCDIMATTYHFCTVCK